MTIGEDIATARNKVGLSIAEVSERTRIRPHLIQAIESDDFAACGGDVYARGHIKTLAGTLSLETDPLLAQYDDLRAPPPSPTVKEVFTAGRGRVEPRTFNWSAVMAGLLVTAVAYGGFRLANATDQRTPQRFVGAVAPGSQAASQAPAAVDAPPGQAAQLPGVEIPSPSAGAPSAAAPTVGPPAAGAPGGKVAVKPTDRVEINIRAVDDQAWLSVTGTNGKELFRGTLPRGKAKKFSDKKMITLVVSNAAAIKLEVNGKDVGSLGKRGEVVRLTYKPGDPKAKG